MPAQQREHVLLVEDNKPNQLLAVAVLTRLGYRADVVDNGREAVEAVMRGDYAAVLMDCRLPEMDGYRATAEIRRREGPSRHTPIIAMTASALPQDQERCLAAGMDGYIAKPMTLERVREVLAHWVHGEAAAAPADRAAAAGSVLQHDRLALLSKLDAAGERPAVVARVVDAFLTRVPADLAALRAAARRGDATALGDAAHDLKGAAAAVGSTGMMHLCDELQALPGAAVATAAHELVRRLEEEFERIRGALESAAGRTEATR
jgi:two-component system sensor histidine kinase/response regulator